MRNVGGYQMKRLWAVVFCCFFMCAVGWAAREVYGEDEQFPTSWNLCVMDAAGGPITALAKGFSRVHRLSWSPDGKRITFHNYFEAEVGVFHYNLESKNLERLHTAWTNPDWSPDGRRIAIVKAASSIWVMDGLTGANAEEIIYGTGLTDYPNWSPDGNKIYYDLFSQSEGTTNIKGYDLSSGEGFSLTNSVSGPLTVRSYQPNVSVGPMKLKTGTHLIKEQIVFLKQGGADLDNVGGIWIMDADGSNQRKILPWYYGAGSDLFDRKWETSHPVLSPDMTRIAFVAKGQEPGVPLETRTRSPLPMGIYTMKADGTGWQRVTPNDEYASYPEYSPDGTRIAFWSTASGEKSETGPQLAAQAEPMEDAMGVRGQAATSEPKGAESVGAGAPAAKVEPAPKRKGSWLEAITKRRKLWQLSPNPDLKGMRGRLVIKFPEGTKARVVHVYEPGAQKVDIQDAWGKPMELLEGKYDIGLNGARVAKVSIKKGNDTRLLVGAVRLNTKFGTRVEILDENKTKVFATATGPTIVALPVGKYFGDIKKKTVELDVRDGQITDF